MESTFFPTADTNITDNGAGHAATNYGSQTTVSIGVFTGPEVVRGLFRFDLGSAETGEVVAVGSTITLATLTLAVGSLSQGANFRDFAVHELNEKDWVETEATGNIYATGLSWTGVAAEGDYSILASATVTGPSAAPATIEFDLTELIAGLIVTTQVIDVIIRLVVEGSTRYGVTVSSRTGTTPPVLTIEHEAPVPEESSSVSTRAVAAGYYR